MLSAASRPLIEASVPVLRAHGLDITRVFYARMFEAEPQLRNLFNMGNQASGAQQQSLAAAIFAYAANIDNAAALAPVVERIAQKHAAVGILPGHYHIVGRNLLAAIREVLGEAATPALIAAWDEAYWLLAGTLIAREACLYDHSGHAAGALRPLAVARVVEEAEGVRSFYLVDAAGRSPGMFKPGEYVSVAVTRDGLRQLRQYSLSDAPSRPWWRITVKREDGAGTPAGMVSTLLHDTVAAGDVLPVGLPFGDFVPDLAASHPLVMASAGVGITPMVSMLKTLAEAGSTRRIVFAHAARHAGAHAMAAEVEACAASLPGLEVLSFHEEAPRATGALAGRMRLDALLPGGFIEAGEALLCGPAPFMAAQRAALIGLGMAPGRIRREVFGPELLEELLAA